MTNSRSSGVLLHITSLPGPFGIGDLGPSAYRFADFLAQSKQRIWQVLPLVPLGHGNSPYSSPSTFARNPLLISPERLKQQGLLRAKDLNSTPNLPESRVNYHKAIPFKFGLLKKAFERFEQQQTVISRDEFEAFCQSNQKWLNDYALFAALKEAYNQKAWTAWDPSHRSRHPQALNKARQRFAKEIRMHKFWQYLFTQQWKALKTYCHKRSIRFFGDLPIYVAHDSADVWAHPDLFYLDETGQPTVVAGVPPDYFSETGQRWGNPIYRWTTMQANNYSWWSRRFSSTLELVDLLRLDHFRAFEAYWEIPAEEETAVNGTWKKGPGSKLFKTVENNLGQLPVVAEDLGLITPEVTQLMEELNFPGMAVLQFGFMDSPRSKYLPHNYVPNLVAYTGTHDNDTVAGWWSDIDPKTRRFTQTYLDLENKPHRNIHWSFVRSVMSSVANTTIFPLQDLLGLGKEARMNRPGQGGGNWGWRVEADQITSSLADQLQALTEVYARTGETDEKEQELNQSAED